MHSLQSDKAIISDTSCLITLTNIGKLDILKKMYKELVITPEVAKEYKHKLPEWIIIKNVVNKDKITELQNNNLDLGESSAIALAMETPQSVLILDDDKARKFARKNGLQVTGTLTIVANACDLGLIESYEAACDELRKIKFRFTDKIQEDIKKTTQRRGMRR